MRISTLKTIQRPNFGAVEPLDSEDQSWRARFGRRILTWLKNHGWAQHPTVEDIQVREVSTDRFIDAVMAQVQGIQGVLNLRGKYIIMGPAQFDEAMRWEGPATRQYIEVPIRVGYKTASRYGQPFNAKILDLIVIVVPWFDGVLVLPEGETE